MATPTTDRTSVLATPYRALTLGVVLSVTMVGFQTMGVVTVLPVIANDLNGMDLYGWGLSSSMLANIIGTVVAGRLADRWGPSRPFAVATALFIVGAVMAAIAPTWTVFMAAQAVTGLGVGAIAGMAYMTVGRAYPSDAQPRMIAVLSSAWVVPSLVGPAIAGTIAEVWNWQVVFLVLLPIAVIAAVLARPGLAAIKPTGTADGGGWRPLVYAVVLSGGVAMFIASFSLNPLWLLLVVAIAGAAIAIPALRQVTPDGTLSMRRGVPAGVAVRFLAACAFFGADTMLPLGLTEHRGLSATQAGFALTAGALTWTIGSAIQAKMDTRGWSRTTVTVAGGFLLFGGIGLIALTVLTDSLPALLAVIGWAIGGFGMGLAYNASSTSVVENTPAEQQGAVGGSLQLAQTLSTALMSGLGGAAVALAPDLGGTARGGLGVAFGLAALGALVLTLTAHRMRMPTVTRS